MNSTRVILLGFLIAVSQSWQFAAAQTPTEILDFTAPLQPKDNFLEASFRFVNPDPPTIPESVLLFIPGTDADGRGVVTDQKFLSICKTCHAALLGCYFRGEGLPYDDPSGGSGRAVDEALAYFAAQMHQATVAHAPLFLVGLSQGGMFTFNYVCWRPEQVKGFGALKAIFPKLIPKQASFQVPGFLAAGEFDDPGRIRAIAKTFADAAGKSSRWAFLYEKGSGHDMGHCVELAGALFDAVSQKGDNAPVVLNSQTGNPEPASSANEGASWFPNQQVADFWKTLNKPTPLQGLISMPDRLLLQSFVSTSSDSDVYVCPNGDSKTGIVSLSVNNPDVTVRGLKISGDGFSVEEGLAGKFPMQIKIHFAPQGLMWGHHHGDLEISGDLKGQDIGTIDVPLSGTVKGPLLASPSVAYLGVISPGQGVDQVVILKSISPSVHVAQVQVPDRITATIDLPKPGGKDLHLNVHWTAGLRLGRMEGEILLTVDSPEKGTLRIPVFGTIVRSLQ